MQPDLVLVHSPFVPPKGQLAALWKILEDLKDSGELTASLGVSNFRPQVRCFSFAVFRMPLWEATWC